MSLFLSASFLLSIPLVPYRRVNQIVRCVENDGATMDLPVRVVEVAIKRWHDGEEET